MMVIAMKYCQQSSGGNSTRPYLVKYRTSECSMPAIRSSVDKAIAVEDVLPFIAHV
jgi:hypothetical protein